MNRHQAEAFVHSIATSDPRRVFLTRHARVRDAAAAKPPLSRAEIVEVLRSGRISEGPVEDIRVANGWKFTMAADFGGWRLYVVGVFIPETRILVITAYEDRSAAIPRPRPRLGSEVE